MGTPKPTPRPQNWQVQELDGSPIDDFATEALANSAALMLRTDLQRPVRVRRTA